MKSREETRQVLSLALMLRIGSMAFRITCACEKYGPWLPISLNRSGGIEFYFWNLLMIQVGWASSPVSRAQAL
jgi:hypothetical protein